MHFGNWGNCGWLGRWDFAHFDWRPLAQVIQSIRDLDISPNVGPVTFLTIEMVVKNSSLPCPRHPNTCSKCSWTLKNIPKTPSQEVFGWMSRVRGIFLGGGGFYQPFCISERFQKKTI